MARADAEGCASWLIAAGRAWCAKRARSQRGERRLPQQIAAIQHHLGSLDLPSRSIQQDHRPILG